MFDFIKNNVAFILACLLWWLVGRENIIAGGIVVIITYLFLIAKQMYQEQLLGLIFLIILSDNRYLPFAQSVKPIVLILMFFAMLLNEELRFKATFHKLFIPFFIIAVISLFFSPDFISSFSKFSSYILLFLTIPSYALYLYNKDKEEFLKSLVYLIFIVLLTGVVLNFVSSEAVTFKDSGRFKGIFGNPNGIAMFCVLALMFFVVAKYQFKCFFSKQETVFFYGVLGLSLLWSGSRNALMSAVIFLTVIRANKLSPIFSFLLLVIIVLFYELILNSALGILVDLGYQKQLRLGEGAQSIENASGRMVAWRFAWGEIQKNFFFGMGWAYDEILFYNDKVQLYLNNLNHQGGVHNSYLIIWLNEGLIGLVFYLFAMVMSFLKAAKNSLYAIPMMLALFFMAMYEPWMAASLNPYTVQMIMILTLLISMPQEELNSNITE